MKNFGYNEHPLTTGSFFRNLCIRFKRDPVYQRRQKNATCRKEKITYLLLHKNPFCLRPRLRMSVTHKINPQIVSSKIELMRVVTQD